MNLTNRWEYILKVAEKRLENNITEMHLYGYGDELEILGVAGEIAARRFFQLPEEVHEGFDHGVDMTYNGYDIDVKSSHIKKHKKKILQWPIWKWVKADIIVYVGINPKTKYARVMGYVPGSEILKAPINHTRPIPCHEIPVEELYDPKELLRLPTNLHPMSETRAYFKP